MKDEQSINSRERTHPAIEEGERESTGLLFQLCSKLCNFQPALICRSRYLFTLKKVSSFVKPNNGLLQILLILTYLSNFLRMTIEYMSVHDVTMIIKSNKTTVSQDIDPSLIIDAVGK